MFCVRRQISMSFLPVSFGRPTVEYSLLRSALEVRGPVGNYFSRPTFPVNLHQGLYLYVFGKPRVDDTLPGAIGPIGLRPALFITDILSFLSSFFN